MLREWPVLAADLSTTSGRGSAWNGSLHQLPQQIERLLPAHVALIGRDHGRDAFLLHVELRAGGDLLQDDGGDHLAGQVGVVEAVGVYDALTGLELPILATEGVAMPARDVGELHAVASPYPRVHLQDAPGKAVRRQPLGHR